MIKINKTVLITGASRGIGNSIARVFADNNYNVIINYLNSEISALDLEASLKEEGKNALAFKADVRNREEVDEMVQRAVMEFGSVDVLINNAGISQQKLFTEITKADWDDMLDVHINGTYNLCQSVLPYMLEKKQGKIINISSIWGLVGASCEVHYSTAKAAMIGFTKALAKELGPSNIQVNCIAPGIIDTDMNSFLNEDEAKDLIDQTPLMKFGKPEDIAYAALYFASQKADFITGQVLSPNGGFVI